MPSAYNSLALLTSSFHFLSLDEDNPCFSISLMRDSIDTLASPLIGSSIGMTFPNSFLSISIWIILASSLNVSTA